jgi:hypothetical protein
LAEELQVQGWPLKASLEDNAVAPTACGVVTDDEHEGDRERLEEEEFRAMQATVHKYFGMSMAPVPEVIGHPVTIEEAEQLQLNEKACSDPFEAIREGAPLYTLSEELRADKEVVLAAIAREGAFCYDYIASPTLKRADRDVVLALVAADGSMLEHASLEMRADRQIVRIALRTCSQALKFAPKSLQADRELKLAASSRAKEEQRLMKQISMKACAPTCFPR